MAIKRGIPVSVGAPPRSGEKSPPPTGMGTGTGRKINPRAGTGTGAGPYIGPIPVPVSPFGDLSLNMPPSPIIRLVKNPRPRPRRPFQLKLRKISTCFINYSYICKLLAHTTPLTTLLKIVLISQSIILFKNDVGHER